MGMFKVCHSLPLQRGMERDHLRFEVDRTGRTDAEEGFDQPVLRIQFEGAQTQLADQLTAQLREGTTAEDIDISFRFLGPSTKAQRGVLALTDRVTGDYMFECDGDGEPIHDLIQTVRERADSTGETAAYAVEIRARNGVVSDFSKEVLLVYTADGTLLRHDSLIPGHIEM